MYRLLSISFLFLLACSLQAQERQIVAEGTISYITATNVYVKFADTEAIPIGDTLFVQRNQRWEAALIVQQKSSISCVAQVVGEWTPEKGMTLAALSPWPAVPVQEPEPVLDIPTQSEPPITNLPAPQDESEDGTNTEGKNTDRKEKITGRISAASYSIFSDDAPRHRLRYGFSFRGDHLSDSRFSTEAYITFRHTAGEWEEVTANVFDALKIFNLAVKYEPTDRTLLTLGRKINPRISSMGAIDGLQAEHAFGAFQVGVMAGSRPNLQDYRIDPGMFQAGAYIGFATQSPGRSQQNTLALIEQRNQGEIDRRFIYVQHTDNLLPNLNVFASCEMDLYQKVNEEVTNNLTLTNLFTSLRYRFSRTLSASVSYDNRKNVIFFESFKNYIDQLIDEETRQGLRVSASYRVFKRVSLGANASWRFQKSNTNTSQNINGYITYSRLPAIQGNLTLTVNALETSYQKSRYYGCRYTRDFFKGRLNGDLYYRWIDYVPTWSEVKTHQDIAGLSLSWRITKKLSLYLYYEETFDARYPTVSRFNTKLMQRI
ncbi:MAG: TonB-dependent receptor [Saprospiraceae bacterium]|nr:TonB-dependent receptor [Saprospiraceae bacterium]